MSVGFPSKKTAAGGVVTNCANDTQLAGLLSGGGTITFNCAGMGAAATILFTATRTISSPTSVTIDGGNLITLSGGGVRRLFIVAGGASLSLLNITLTAGSDFGGGAVQNDGTLTVTDARLTGNTASGQFGGAIKNTGTLRLTGSQLTGNSAPSGYGGAIDSAETTSLVVVERTIFTNNTAGLGGGAIANNGTLQISDSTFSGNSAGSGYGGGAVENTGPLTISASTFNGNSAGKGGAVYNEGGSTTITNSTFSANTANKSPFTGGGLHNQSGTTAGTLRLSASTLHNNSAPGGTGGSLYNAGGNTLQVRLSLLSGGTPANCSGTITSLGLNLDSGSTCAFQASGDLSNTPASLAALGSNGGFTQTHALQPGSPAIDLAAPGQCTDTGGTVIGIDQRGQPRPVDGNGDGTARCDSGAYEAAAASPAPTPTPTRTRTPTATPTRTPTPTATRTALPTPDCATRRCYYIPLIQK